VLQGWWAIAQTGRHHHRPVAVAEVRGNPMISNAKMGSFRQFRVRFLDCDRRRVRLAANAPINICYAILILHFQNLWATLKKVTHAERFHKPVPPHT